MDISAYLYLLLVIISKHMTLCDETFAPSGLLHEDKRKWPLSEKRLYKHLFGKKSYNPLVRPVRNESETIEINFGMALIQIISIDGKKQILKTNAWLRLLWPDYQLTWRPEEFGNLTQLRVTPDHVWKPDMVLFNNADGKYNVSFMSNVALSPDGWVHWIPPTIYKTHCFMDMQYFPFDEHECELEYGSSTYTSKKLSFNWYGGLENIDLNDYIKSGSWDLVNSSAFHRKSGSGESEDIRIVFKITIRRKTLFYTVNLILPCIFIEFLNVCVFLLPPDTTEKAGFSVAIMIALLVYLLVITSLMPQSLSTPPLIARFVLFSFILNLVTSAISFTIININFRTPRTHSMNKWIKIIFLTWFPKFLCIKLYEGGDDAICDDAATNNVVSKNKKCNLNCIIDNQSQGDLDACSEFERTSCNESPNCVNIDKSLCCTCGGNIWIMSNCFDKIDENNIPIEIEKATSAIRFVAAHLKAEDTYGDQVEEWQYIALVMDRINLYIFSIVTFGGAIGYFLPPLFIYDDYIDTTTI